MKKWIGRWIGEEKGKRGGKSVGGDGGDESWPDGEKNVKKKACEKGVYSKGSTFLRLKKDRDPRRRVKKFFFVGVWRNQNKKKKESMSDMPRSEVSQQLNPC